MKKSLFLIALTFLCFQSNAQWSSVTVPSATQSFRSVFFKSTTDGFIAGGERIRRTTNGGTTWDTVSHGTYAQSLYLRSGIVEAIHFVSATEGIAAGWNFPDNCEMIYKTHDGGATWTDIRFQGVFDTYLYDMYFQSSTTGYCVGDHGHIVKSTNGGDTWNYLTSGTTNGLKGVWFTSSTNGFAVGDQIILKTTNGGTSWTSQSFTGVYFSDVCFTNLTTGYALSYQKIYKTTDGGTTWNLLNNNLGGYDLYAVNNDTIFIAADNGIYKSNNAGSQFLLQPTIIPNEDFQSVYFYNTTLGFAVNSTGQVFRTTTQGDPVQRNDAGVTSIAPLPAGTCQGLSPVKVAIRNYGQANLTQARIEWKVNGVAQTPYVWTGNLAFDSTSALITLGNYNFPKGIFTIDAYTTQANSVADYIHSNDTARTTYTLNRLSGTYTVGGTTPDYADLKTAVNDLNTYGICGNVIFNIRNGTYTPNTRFSIGNLPRNHPADSVFFQSASGDSSLVILEGISANMLLTNSKNITFSKISFRNTGSGNLVELTDSTENISFLNCLFLTPASGKGIYHSGKACMNLAVKNCRFLDGTYGIQVSILGAGSPQLIDGVTIQQCAFDSLNQRGIEIGYSKNILVRSNTITGKAAIGLYGISLTACNNGFVVDRNKVITYRGRSLFSLGDCLNTAGAEGWVTNNFFSEATSFSTSESCIGFGGSAFIKFIGNTVNTISEYPINIPADDTTFWPQHTFVNNIIYGRKMVPLFFMGGFNRVSNFYLSKVFTAIGHNGYYNPPGFVGTSPYMFWKIYAGHGDFNEWKGMFPSDSTSVFADPQFSGYADYHVLPRTTNIPLNNTGIPVTGITTDIDGITRNALNPDPGCSEFNLYVSDAGIQSFADPTRICSGVNAVHVKIGNYGSNAITSGTVNWQVNGIAQTAFPWSGNIAAGATSSLVAIGTYNFIANTTYIIKAWMSNANGGTDANHANDTLTTTAQAKGLSGTYTVGGTSPSYSTLTAAMSDLNTNGICGPVTFNIRPGIYHESITVPLVAGTSETNRVILQSENQDSTSVMIHYSGAKVITVDTSSYITIKQITIVDSTSINQSCIYFRGRASHILVDRCQLFNYSNGILAKGDGQFLTDVVFSNNYFRGGRNAAQFNATDGNRYHDNIRFTGNRMENFHSYGIEIRVVKNLLIDGNTLQSRLDPATGSAGLYITSRSIYDAVLNTVTNNKLELRNFVNGIQFYSDGGPYNKGLLANNMVTLYGPEAYTAYHLQNTRNARLIYNSGLIDSCSVPNSYVLFFPNEGCEIVNNSFYHKGGGSAVYFYPGTTNAWSDYNMYFSNSGFPVDNFFDQLDLPSWQIYSGNDPHSISGNPNYVSLSDLHTTGSYYLNASALPQPDLLKDIDGNTRNATLPDIGADEHTLSLQANDAGIRNLPDPGILCPGSNPVRVVLKNYGSSPLTSATIRWKVNGALQAPYSWSGNLASQAIATVTIGNFNFGIADTNIVLAWTSSPNGATDLVAANDSGMLVNLYTNLTGNFTLGGTSPDFATFDAFFLALKDLGVCGPVTLRVRNGTYPGPRQRIGEIAGASAVNNIVVQSESGDSSLVVINDDNVNTHTFDLYGVDYLTLKAMTIYGDGSHYPVSLENGSNYCVIRSCALYGQVRIYRQCHHNTLEYCYVTSRISAEGELSDRGVGNSLRYNTLVSNYGMYVYQQDSVLVEGNFIKNPDAFAGSYAGLRIMGNGSHFVCNKNRISGNFTIGLQLEDGGEAGDTAIVANNIVIAGNLSGWCAAVNNSYVKFIYNTLYVPASSSAAPFSNGVTPTYRGLLIQNNQFICDGTDYATVVGQQTGATLTKSDYNNYFTNGPTLIRATSVNYATLAAYKAAFPSYDINSINVNPQFPSPGFVFPSNAAARSTGSPVYGVTDDINGYPRHATTPTAGAYEIAPVIVRDSVRKDIGITLLNNSLATGNNPISVRIKNSLPYAQDTSLYHYEGRIDTLFLSYSVNGAAPVLQTWAGSLAIGDSVSVTFITPYFVPKGKIYNVHVEAHLPVKYTAVNPGDDSLTKAFAIPMAGTYTVGGTTPDFADLKTGNALLTQIHAGGDVIFSIRNGLDTLKQLSNYSDPHEVTYTSESGNATDVKIVLWNITNCNRISFEQVTIYPRTNPDVLYTNKGAEIIGSQFRMDQCVIRGLSDPYFRNGITFLRTDSLSIINCQFRDLDNGITLSDWNASGSNHFAGNNYILHNDFDSVDTAIHLHGFFEDSTFVSYNEINHTGLGIDFNPHFISNYFMMEKNKIGLTTLAAIQAGDGINAFTSGQVRMHNNMIASKVVFRDFDFGAIEMINNSFADGLEFYDCRQVMLYNNSVYAGGMNPALYYDLQLTGSILYDGDYNNYYSPNAGRIAEIHILGGANGNATNIADLVAMTGYEYNSVSADPRYTSATDLHSVSPVMCNAALPVTFITTDIDGQPRSSSSPDIGCDEFSVADSVVWPGDCNFDGTANNYDLLSVGLYFNQPGIARATVTNTWAAQSSTNWGSIQYCGWDKKHADCNGDGVVNFSDTTAIRQNWGQVHAFRQNHLPPNVALNDLYLDYPSVTYIPGDTVVMDLWLDGMQTPAPPIAGIAFDLSIPQEALAGSMYISFDSSLIGVENVTAISTSNFTTMASGAISRITGNDTSGYGIICRIGFIIDSTVTNIDHIDVAILNYLAVTSSGSVVQFNTWDAWLPVNAPVNTFDHSLAEMFTIYPNPANKQATLTWSLNASSQVKIDLLDVTGREIQQLVNENQSAGIHQHSLDAKDKLAKGIYLVKMTIDQKVSVRKLILE